MHNEVINSQTMTATLIIISAIMGFAFSAAVQSPAIKSVLFFVAESVAIIAIFQSTDRGRLAFLIASYLRIFTEEKLRQLKWETRIMEFRKLCPREGYGDYISNILWTYAFLAIGNFGLVIWFAVQASLKTPGFYEVLLILTIGFIATLLLIRTGRKRHARFIYKHKETFDPIWEKIKDDETSSNAKR